MYAEQGPEGDKEPVRVLCKTQLKTELVDKTQMTEVCEYVPPVARFFVTYPLIGSEDFPFPVVHSACFDPLQERHGISIGTENNWKTLMFAVEATRELLDEMKTLVVSGDMTAGSVATFAAFARKRELHDFRQLLLREDHSHAQKLQDEMSKIRQHVISPNESTF